MGRQSRSLRNRLSARWQGMGFTRTLATPKFWLAALAAVTLATLAFANAAAQVGANIAVARPLGGQFYDWRDGQARVEQRIVRQGERAATLSARRSAVAVLDHTPLSSRALWMVAMEYAARGNRARARTAMLQAQAVSRREAPVQMWLADDAARRGDVASALGHLDLILRTRRRGGNDILNRMVAVLPNPDARAALLPYLGPSNVWRTDFINLASQRGESAEPFARLLLANQAALPSSASDRAAYRNVLMRLASERRFASMLALYRRLPGAQSERLSTVSINANGFYQPIEWSFPDGRSATGEVVLLDDDVPALDLYAAAGTSGIAAMRFVEPGTARRIAWTVEERNDNVDGDARLVLRCVAGAGVDAVLRSTNLLATRRSVSESGGTGSGTNSFAEQDLPSPRTRFAMALPGNCSLLRVEVSMIGGTGRDPAMLVLSRLRLLR